MGHDETFEFVSSFFLGGLFVQEWFGESTIWLGNPSSYDVDTDRDDSRGSAMCGREKVPGRKLRIPAP